jgi:hypothetical protein
MKRVRIEFKIKMELVSVSATSWVGGGGPYKRSRHRQIFIHPSSQTLELVLAHHRAFTTSYMSHQPYDELEEVATTPFYCSLTSEDHRHELPPPSKVKVAITLLAPVLVVTEDSPR